MRDKVGRTRYVAFRIVLLRDDAEAPRPAGRGGFEPEPSIPRPALSGALPPAAKLTRFDGTYGILRTTHRDRDALLGVLEAPRRLGSREVRIETLRTSGTIRGAARALPAASPASRRSPRPRDDGRGKPGRGKDPGQAQGGR